MTNQVSFLQALCKRTLNIVEALNEKHSERMRFYLSKADEVGYECDRQRVMMQIVQELCKRPGLNRTGFDMPTICIPHPTRVSMALMHLNGIFQCQFQNVRCVNQIGDVCDTIEKTINQTIQNTLNHLERDCDEIKEKVDEAIVQDNAARSHNMGASGKGFLLLLIGIMFPISLALNLLASSLSDKLITDVIGRQGFQYLLIILVSIPLGDHFCIIASRFQLLPLSLSARAKKVREKSA